MRRKAGPHSLDWLWLAVAAASVALCAALPAFYVIAPIWMPESEHAAGKLAGICVEFGRNAAGRQQVGLWWEASDATMAKPGSPPVRTLHMFCGIYPWTTALPMRGTFLHTY